MISPPLCISVEGIDGAGKSTFIAELADRLRHAGVELLLTREPGGTPVGDAIREIVKSSLTSDPWTQALLFAASRRALVEEVIRPTLAGGTWVLIDRFVDSMFVYQTAQDVTRGHLRDLHQMTTDGFLPDLTFFIDTPPEIAYQRVLDRGATDDFDSVGLDRYRYLAQCFRDRLATDLNSRIVRIDGQRSLKQMVALATNYCLPVTVATKEVEANISL